MLNVSELRSGYGPMNILHGISLTVEEGEIVSILGANGAGKTTLLRAISGLIPCRSGDIRFAGQSLKSRPPERIVRLGLSHVPQGRELFGDLTVEQNLRLGAYGKRLSQAELRTTREQVFTLFPVLERKSGYRAASLSGGEQQMVALGRALMAGPRLLLLDEPSLGLAPLVTESIFEAIRKLRDLGLSMLVVEQNASAVLRIADRGYVVDHGRIAAEASADDLLRDDLIQKNYLGL